MTMVEQDDDFDGWIRQLNEDVCQDEFGYEPGEFTVYPNHWRPLYDEGLTPLQAFQRALDAHRERRLEEDAERRANYERIKAEDAKLLQAALDAPARAATGREAMKDLIAALESATEPSIELDCKIWCELNGKKLKEFWVSEHFNDETGLAYTEPPKRTRIVHSPIPKFTASIDAAVTLYPKTPYSNIAGFLQSAMYQTCIGDIPDEVIACRISAHALKARDA